MAKRGNGELQHVKFVMKAGVIYKNDLAAH
jgi:hypothetical protein